MIEDRQEGVREQEGDPRPSGPTGARTGGPEGVRVQENGKAVHPRRGPHRWTPSAARGTGGGTNNTPDPEPIAPDPRAGHPGPEATPHPRPSGSQSRGRRGPRHLTPAPRKQAARETVRGLAPTRPGWHWFGVPITISSQTKDPDSMTYWRSEWVLLAGILFAASCELPTFPAVEAGWSVNRGSVIVRTAPPAPSSALGKPITAAMQDRIAVMWTPAEGRVLGYQVESCHRGHAPCDTLAVPDTVEAVIRKPGMYTEWYDIRVRAWNSGGYGPWSEEVHERTAYAGVVMESTVWLLPTILTADDATAHDSTWHVASDSAKHQYAVDYSGHRMTWWVDVDDSTHAMLDTYAPLIGHLPTALLRSIERVDLLADGPGVRADPCGRGVSIPSPGSDEVWANGYMEEVILHEAGHTLLNSCESEIRHDRAPSWLAAQEADGIFITRYAREHPIREDGAETIWAWFVSRCVPGRVHSALVRTIKESIPNRLAYLDQLELDMSPFRC